MRTITVKGVGSVSAKPDYITLSLVIESTDKEYDIALQKATKRMQSSQKNLQTGSSRVFRSGSNFRVLCHKVSGTR